MANRQFSSLFSILFLLATLNLAAQSTKDEYGTATYYGNEFHGRKTASGEKYDKNKLTCAHRTLPFGTTVRVTRLDNKKSVDVRVTDRGPFIKGYIVDLSRAAAERIGMIAEGVVKVKLEVVGKEKSEALKPEARSTTTEKPTAERTTVPDTPAPKPEKEEKKEKKEATKASPKVATGQPKLVTSRDFETYGLYQIELRKPQAEGFGVQVASFSDFDNVLKEVAKLQKNWGGKVLVNTAEPMLGKDSPSYRIILGPFSDEKTADKNRKSAAKKGYPKSFLVNLEELK